MKSKEHRSTSQKNDTVARFGYGGEERELGITGAVSRFIEGLFKECPKYLQQRAPALDHPFLIIGHRGSPTQEVENTLPSFELALSEGANALELDLCITKDGEVVLWHDWDPHDFVVKLRHQGLEPIVRYTTYAPEEEKWQVPVDMITLENFRSSYGYCDKSSFEQVERHIPTFAEFVEWLLSKSLQLRALFLDIKVPEERMELLPLLMNVISDSLQLLPSETAIVFESTSERVLREMRNIYPQARYALDTEIAPGLVLFPRRHSSVRKAIRMGNSDTIPLRPRPITIAPWATYRRLIAYDARRRHKHNQRYPDRRLESLIGATINDPEEMECLIKLGIGGMQTDIPGILRGIANSHQLKV